MTKRVKPPVKLLLSCFLLLLTFAGCHHEQKFTPEKWDMGDGLTFNLRDGIVDDLLATHKFEGMKFRQVIHLLKHPQYGDSTKFYYEIVDTHTNLQKADHIKNLVFYMGKDSVINKVELYDNKAKVKSRYF